MTASLLLAFYLLLAPLSLLLYISTSIPTSLSSGVGISSLVLCTTFFIMGLFVDFQTRRTRRKKETKSSTLSFTTTLFKYVYSYVQPILFLNAVFYLANTNGVKNNSDALHTNVSIVVWWVIYLVATYTCSASTNSSSLKKKSWYTDSRSRDVVERAFARRRRKRAGDDILGEGNIKSQTSTITTRDDLSESVLLKILDELRSEEFMNLCKVRYVRKGLLLSTFGVITALVSIMGFVVHDVEQEKSTILILNFNLDE